MKKWQEHPVLQLKYHKRRYQKNYKIYRTIKK